MVQGTGSNVGKSLIVAGLCRVLARRGLAVRPFKPQNMSNNAAATPTGGEIGRAQALQARACGVAASVDMNPVLLKPQSETGSQIILQGRRWGTMRAREFGHRKSALMPAVLDSFERLSATAEIVIAEGAGSPAEVNLRAGDIANMGFAHAADVPVIIAGDIERGGVIASLVGTHAVMSPQDRRRIKGFVVNKFRGDTALFSAGLTTVTEHTGWRSLGILAFFAQAALLPAEDILDLDRPAVAAGVGGNGERIKIAVPVAGRIANFDDLDPLRLEPRVELHLIYPGRPLPRDCDVVLLPGSKATINDLQALRGQGWDVDIAAHVRHGGWVVGLCGGYQILGRTVSDPDGIEGRAGTFEGLGLLDVETVLGSDKVVRAVTGRHCASASEVSGYEIHLGETTGPDTQRPAFEIDGRAHGATSDTGRIIGTYVHGIFASDAYRTAFLNSVRHGGAGLVDYEATIEAALDGLADHIERDLDVDGVLAIANARHASN